MLYLSLTIDIKCVIYYTMIEQAKKTYRPASAGGERLSGYVGKVKIPWDIPHVPGSIAGGMGQRPVSQEQS